MDGEHGSAQVRDGRCPRCEVCGRVVRVRGVGRVGVAFYKFDLWLKLKIVV